MISACLNFLSDWFVPTDKSILACVLVIIFLMGRTFWHNETNYEFNAHHRYIPGTFLNWIQARKITCFLPNVPQLMCWHVQNMMKKILVFILVLIPSTLLAPQGSLKCMENGKEYDIGAKIWTRDPCEHCECVGNGKRICFIQDCAPPQPGCQPTKGLCCTFECPKLEFTLKNLKWNSL